MLVDGQVRGSLSDINPEDIESMEVLKTPMPLLFMVLALIMV
ncbi:Plug domain-containing protein [Bacteroides fragilis]|nr:Plug domain-containing protein [Bacteroides fragilis]